MNTKRLTTMAMLAAVCSILGYISVDLGSLKVSFESFPVLVGAILYGPADGLLIGAIGTLVSQLLKYGVSVTTPLWMLPYIVVGAVMGGAAKAKGFQPDNEEIWVWTFVCEFLALLLNTLALVVDSKVFGYYTPLYIYGSLIPRTLIFIGKAVVFSYLLTKITKRIGG